MDFRKNILRLQKGLFFLLPLVFVPGIEYPFAVGKTFFLRVFCLVIFGLTLGYVYSKKVELKLPERLVKAQAVFVGGLLLAGGYLISTGLSLSPTLSFWGSVHRQQGLLTYLLLGGLMLSLVLIRPSVDEQKELTDYVCYSSVVVVLIALMSRFGFMGELLFPEQFAGRAAGTFQHPTFMAFFLLIVAALVAGKMVKEQKFSNYLDWGYLAVILFGIILTGTRTALLLFVMVILGSGFVVLKERLTTKKLLLLTGIGLLGLFGVILILAFVRTDAFSLVTGQTRLLIWTTVLGYMGSRFLFGFGMEVLPYSFQEHLPAELFNSEALFSKPDRLHNGVLQIFHDAGLIGLVGAGMLMGYLVYRAYKKDQKDVFLVLVTVFTASLLMFPSMVEQLVLAMVIAMLVLPSKEEEKGLVRVLTVNKNKFVLVILLLLAIIGSVTSYQQIRAGYFQGAGNFDKAASLETRVPEYKQQAVFQSPELLDEYKNYLLRYNSSSVEIGYLEARTYYLQQEYAKSMVLLDELLVSAPSDIRLLQLLFDDYFYSGDYLNAEKTKDRILELVPAHWKECTMLEFENGSCTDRGRILFKDNPELRVYFLKFGQLMVSLNKLEKADEYLAYTYFEPDYYYTLFLKYSLTGEAGKAMEILKEGLVRFPDADLLKSLLE